MGPVGQQPPREVLPAHARRAKTGRAGDPRVGAGHRDPRALPLARGSVVRLLRAWFVRLGSVFRRGRDSDLTEELGVHLDMHVADNLRVGMTPNVARREALVKLGGIELTNEQYRDRRGVPFVDTLLQDLRYAGRTLL